MDEFEPVEVYSLNDPETAEIIQNALRSEGIPCEIEGEHQAGLSGILNMRLMVRARDEDRARALIKSHMPEER